MTDSEILHIYKDSVFHWSKEEVIKGQKVKVESGKEKEVNLAPQLVILYYLMLYEDTVLNNMKVISKYWTKHSKQNAFVQYFLCRLRSIAAHRDHVVRCLSVCPYICLCIRLSGSHTFLVVTHSYVSLATRAFLGMLPLFSEIFIYVMAPFCVACEA